MRYRITYIELVEHAVEIDAATPADALDKWHAGTHEAEAQPTGWRYMQDDSETVEEAAPAPRQGSARWE